MKYVDAYQTRIFEAELPRYLALQINEWNNALFSFKKKTMHTDISSILRRYRVTFNSTQLNSNVYYHQT